ncbi:hypothetical protein ACFWPJ_32575, partial [Nocardia sp. NPDC058497]
MRSYRLLVILLSIVAAVVVGAFIAVIKTDSEPAPEGQPPSATTPGSAPKTTPPGAPTRPPPVGLYGNRSEVPAP